MQGLSHRTMREHALLGVLFVMLLVTLSRQVCAPLCCSDHKQDALSSALVFDTRTLLPGDTSGLPTVPDLDCLLNCQSCHAVSVLSIAALTVLISAHTRWAIQHFLPLQVYFVPIPPPPRFATR